MMPKKKVSKTIPEKKELLELQLEVDLARHKQKMKELSYLRESDRLHYQKEAEKEERKSQGIRETLERKRNLNDRSHYYNG